MKWILLLHSMPGGGMHDSYPALFLYGWGFWYLDSCAGGVSQHEMLNMPAWAASATAAFRGHPVAAEQLLGREQTNTCAMFLLNHNLTKQFNDEPIAVSSRLCNFSLHAAAFSCPKPYSPCTGLTKGVAVCQLCMQTFDSSWTLLLQVKLMCTMATIPTGVFIDQQEGLQRHLVLLSAGIAELTYLPLV